MINLHSLKKIKQSFMFQHLSIFFHNLIKLNKVYLINVLICSIIPFNQTNKNNLITYLKTKKQIWFLKLIYNYPRIIFSIPVHSPHLNRNKNLFLHTKVILTFSQIVIISLLNLKKKKNINKKYNKVILNLLKQKIMLKL